MLVCGDRNWLNRYFPDGKPDNMLMFWILDQSVDVLLTLAKAHGVDTVIEGCARGGDHVGEVFSQRFSGLIKQHLHFPAEWDRYGKRAGPLRNIQMLDEGKPDFVVAFHDNLMESKGTRHMVSIADAAGIDVFGYNTEILSERARMKNANR